MHLAILLSQRNIEYGTGGAFGAAVFDLAAKQLLSVGVNIGVSAHCSIALAEIVHSYFSRQNGRPLT